MAIKGTSHFPSLNVGVTFEGESSLEVENPENLQEMSVNTEVELYFNVSGQARGGDDRAFVLYIGNEVGTSAMMPHTSTDDYMALELVEGGKAKLTVDLGAGVTEIQSNEAIKYDQWNKLELVRKGYEVTMTISSEDGPGEITRDTVKRDLKR